MKTDKSTNDSFDFSFLTPKTILIFAFLMCFTSFVWGQSQYSYYILEKSGYSNGIYTITLVCDGAVVDSKNLIKN